MAKCVKLMVWNREPETVALIKGLMGSVVEIVQTDGNRVVGTVDNYTLSDGDYVFELIRTSIGGKFIGYYRIFDCEVKKWRLKEWTPPKNGTHYMDNTSINGSVNSGSDESCKVIIPSQLNGNAEEEPMVEENEADHLFVNPEVESINLLEDDIPIAINLSHLTLKTSDNLVVVDKMGDNLDAIINSMMASNCVGFELFGEEIGRNGSVEWMSVATAEAIYVFNAHNKDIVLSLKPVLQSREVRKVVFNCRHLSDALYHLFGIQLKAVIDIRVFDLFVQRKRANEALENHMAFHLPKLRTFDEILSDQLMIKVPQLYKNLNYKHFSVRVQNAIIIKTVFLRQLYALLNHQLLEELIIMTARCERSLRLANDLQYGVLKGDDALSHMLDEPINDCERTERRHIGLPAVHLSKPLKR
ncbi:unnamed protein product [Oppiella nova]|uniref:3'-5' exonuclease domain-containing protein n=1 Tax=Oppiella nova TaxID=334625 RepID=A0A7R9ME84_9ACAR|nr:unnamed protein product [Oppiella nova]CAG2175757.1 unnamed protein product [Oppiella nova]